MSGPDLEADGAKLYVPGCWKCPKCNFRLIQSNLNASDGTVTARDTPGDKCPNCNGPLWRVSWKDEANENLAIAENQLQRALAAEARTTALEADVARLTAELEHIARTAEDRSEKGWFRLDTIAETARAALSPAAGVRA